MDSLKQYAGKTFWIVTIYSIIIGGGLCAGIFWGLNWMTENFFVQNSARINETAGEWLFFLVQYMSANFYKIVLPTAIGVFFLVFILLWFILKLSMNALSAKIEDELTASQPKGKKDFVDQKIEQERKRRLFLHMLSVLQRDGRLLDFFQEDLDLYEDDQIGAAVRSIHEDCNKAIKKYIAPKPVLDTAEGEQIEIEAGFDIDAIKLVGNVAGEPPFTGIVKHGGWKAGKKDTPRLSDIHDAGIITPAEVEIV